MGFKGIIALIISLFWVPLQRHPTRADLLLYHTIKLFIFINPVPEILLLGTQGQVCRRRKCKGTQVTAGKICGGLCATAQVETSPLTEMLFLTVSIHTQISLPGKG